MMLQFRLFVIRDLHCSFYNYFIILYGFSCFHVVDKINEERHFGPVSKEIRDSKEKTMMIMENDGQHNSK